MADRPFGTGQTYPTAAAAIAAASASDTVTAHAPYMFKEAAPLAIGAAITLQTDTAGKKCIIYANGNPAPNQIITISVGGVTVNDIICLGPTALGLFECSHATGTNTFNRCGAAHGIAGFRDSSSGGTWIFNNCIAAYCAYGFINNGNTATYNFCAAYMCGGTSTQAGFYCAVANTTAKGCFTYQCVQDFTTAGAGTWIGSENATTRASGGGLPATGAVYSVPDTGLAFAYLPNGDILKVYMTGYFPVEGGGSALLDVGPTGTGITTDWEYRSRGAAPNIGPVEGFTGFADDQSSASLSSVSSQSLSSVSSQSLSSYSTQSSQSLSSVSSASLSSASSLSSDSQSSRTSMSTNSVSSASSQSGVNPSSQTSASLSSASSLSSLSLSSYSSASSATSGAAPVYPSEAGVLISEGPYGPNGNDYLGTFDNVAPAAPSITASTPASGQITLTVDGDAGVTNVCEYRLAGAAAWTTGLTRSGDGNIIQTGLTNGSTYEFRIRSYNASSVYGPPSNSLFAVINTSAEVAGSAISAFMAGIRDQYINSAAFLAWIQSVDIAGATSTNIVLGYSPKDMPDVTTQGPVALIRWANLSAPNSGSSKAFRGTIDIIVDHVFAIGTHARASHTGISDATYISKIISEMVQDVGITLDSTFGGTIVNISSADAWREDPSDARIWHREITYTVEFGLRSDGT